MKKSRYTVPALEKGLSIIELLAHAELPLGVTDLYDVSKIPKSTIFMILTTLESLNYVQKVEDGKYRLTLKLYNTGMATLTKLDIRGIARPVMEKLALDLRFTVHLAMLENGKAIYIEKVKGPGFVQFSTEVGQTLHLHNSGVGKALAAYLPKDTLELYLQQNGMSASTANTITTPEAFHDFLASVRESGFAIEDEEGELGIRCVAAPVFDNLGRIAAALSVTALRNELPSIAFQAIGSKLQESALFISRQLGFEDNDKSVTVT
ncbi:IclR family transcriptional regulator [Paenibacillus sp. MBLB4367]|uniref:IclR family transcriptional regulator n=1 Tax=Paenibacillus sp. MBLB4367 TaxID=3384767 RepID=UPI0039081FEF